MDELNRESEVEFCKTDLVFVLTDSAPVVSCNGRVRGHTRTQAIRGWPGPYTDGLGFVNGLATINKSKNVRKTCEKTTFFAAL